MMSHVYYTFTDIIADLFDHALMDRMTSMSGNGALRVRT